MRSTKKFKLMEGFAAGDEFSTLRIKHFGLSFKMVDRLFVTPSLTVTTRIKTNENKIFRRYGHSFAGDRERDSHGNPRIIRRHLLDFDSSGNVVSLTLEHASVRSDLNEVSFYRMKNASNAIHRMATRVTPHA